MRLSRGSGLLLHPSSLPGPDGIGDLGGQAYRFVDFLAAAGQTLWQVLPLGPPGPGDSPYAGSSAFAGNPLLISLPMLKQGPDTPSAQRVDYGRVTAEKMARLRRAFEATIGDRGQREQIDTYAAENSAWLEDFALFVAIKAAHGGAGWTEWPEGLAKHDSAALDEFRRARADDVEFERWLQFVFDRQWRALKTYAAERGIRIMGDVPIFVAHDSADVWAHPDLFLLDDRGQPTDVAGVPPDYFSPTGQRWGNPHYRWDVLAERGYDWWIDRFKRLFSQVDVVRIDHFRGFAAHWSVPADEDTAINGHWEHGPGAPLFRAIEAAIGDLPIVAEDLGTITPDVDRLRLEFGFPGMRILQFAFGDTPYNPYHPHNYEPNTVVYTGTHDNDTTVGWFATLNETDRHEVRTYLGTDAVDVAWDMIRYAHSSVADTAIVPLQDVLSLESEARMNTPGQGLGNWSWRFHPDQLQPHLAERLKELVVRYNRTGVPLEPDELPEGYEAILGEVTT
jgi:4-alpha-glucanotransferase